MPAVDLYPAESRGSNGFLETNVNAQIWPV
jgi:hypothetical protein